MRQVSTATKVIVLVGLIVFVMALGGGIIFRDYNLSFANGRPELVAKIAVPMVSGLTVDNTKDKKLIVKCPSLGSAVEGYEFRISTHQNMMFSHTYRSEVPKKEIGKLKPGKQYYLQVRCYKNNPAGRSVNGRWGGIHGSRVKQDPQQNN